VRGRRSARPTGPQANVARPVRGEAITSSDRAAIGATNGVRPLRARRPCPSPARNASGRRWPAGPDEGACMTTVARPVRGAATLPPIAQRLGEGGPKGRMGVDRARPGSDQCATNGSDQCATARRTGQTSARPRDERVRPVRDRRARPHLPSPSIGDGGPPPRRRGSRGARRACGGGDRSGERGQTTARPQTVSFSRSQREWEKVARRAG
jgi:hypothetical protein